MKILGIRVDDVDMVQALCFVGRLVSERRSGQIITLNAEILYQAQKNVALKTVIENAAMVTPDGSGVGKPLKKCFAAYILCAIQLFARCAVPPRYPRAAQLLEI